MCRVGGSCFRKTSSSAGKPSAEGRLVTSTKGCTCPLAGLSLSRYHPVHRGKGGGGDSAREKECHVKMLSGNVRCFRSLSCGVSAFASAEDQRRADGAIARLGTRDRGFGVRDRHLAHRRTAPQHSWLRGNRSARQRGSSRFSNQRVGVLRRLPTWQACHNQTRFDARATLTSIAAKAQQARACLAAEP